MAIQKSYYRIILGQGHKYANECYQGEFVGTHYGFDFDLSNELPENWRDFNAKFIDTFLKNNPDKAKIAAGLACATVWVICKGIKKGDIVLCPNGQGAYWVGEVISDYVFQADSFFPHQRKVAWSPEVIARADMSQELQNSTGCPGKYATITTYAEEIESFISGASRPQLISTDESVEDASEFALERHLEDFLVQNWESTELGQNYDIYEDDGELIGQQFPSDTGPIDILAISKDKKELLVVELKKGRASDVVVGQVQRYMGYVQEELTEPNQNVRGVIIALEDDLRLKRALSVTNNIDFYRYQVNFKLFKES